VENKRYGNKFININRKKKYYWFPIKYTTIFFFHQVLRKDLKLEDEDWMEEFWAKLTSKEGHPVLILVLVGGRHGIESKLLLITDGVSKTSPPPLYIS
jgi:hypothetical protein